MDPQFLLHCLLPVSGCMVGYIVPVFIIESFEYYGDDTVCFWCKFDACIYRVGSSFFRVCNITVHGFSPEDGEQVAVHETFSVVFFFYTNDRCSQ